MSKGRVTGLEVCRSNLQKVQKSLEKEAVAALVKWGRETINDSKDNFCPVDQGLLKGTGNITTENEGNKHFVVLFYNTTYAVPVHENPRPYHPIGQSGFLRIPFNQRAPKLVTELKNGFGKVFK